MAQNLKLRKKQKYFKNQKIKYFEKKRKLYLKNYFSLHIKKKNKKPINYFSFLKHWESEKIIYIQESHFLRLQTFFKNKLNLILNTEQCLIKHCLYPKVYYCNETQFLNYLKSNLILETYLSNNYLKYMKKYLKDYNKRQVVLKQPKIIGIFKTINNITLFVRSDVSFLEKFNKRSYRFKAKMIFYFYLKKKLKKLVILKKVFKKLSIKKSFIRIQNSFRLKESGKNMFRIRFKPKQCFINRLDQIYGLDKHKYFFLSKMFGFSKNYYLKPKSLTLMLKVEKYLHKTSAKRNIGFAYKKKYDSRVKQVRKSSLYRGTRHRSNLSVRGQRTRTNARTQKRKKKTESFSFKNNIKVLKKKVIKKNDSKKKKK